MHGDRSIWGNAPTVAVVGELRSLCGADTAALWELLPGGCGGVTIVAVADRHSHSIGVAYMATGSMVVLRADDAVRKGHEEAALRARQIVASAPSSIAVEHLVVGSWSEARAHVRRRGYQSVLLADRPWNLMDRALARLARWRPADPRRDKARIGGTR